MNISRILILVLLSTFVLNVGFGTASLPSYMEELVSITGQQTTPIVWNASNFDGFKYNSSDIPSTETLTIAPYTLNGPDIDRIIEAGNLTYTTSFVLNEYPIFKDLGLYVNNFDDGYSTGYLNGKQYVAINAFSEKLATPLVKFDSNDVKTLRTGDVWDIGGGFSITVLQVDIDGNKVWIELDKDGVFLEDEIISVGYSDLQDRVWTHNEDVAGEYDIPILSLYVSGIMHGEDTDYVQIKYLSLIDNNVSEIFFDDRFGNMELTTITVNSLEFSNWIDLDLSPSNSPSMIMENISFITLDNLSSIEFYPSVVRNETPTLYDASGFISGNYSSLWNLSEGYTIALQEVDIEGSKAMFALLEDGVIIDQKIMTERSIAPNNLDSNYQYIKNGTQIINATLDFAFHGSNSEVANLINVYQWSEVDSSILFSNESHMFKSTSSTGIPWNLSEGYTLTMKDVSLDADEVWLELSKNDVVVKDDILNEYTLNTSIYTSGNGNISYLLDYVFGGTNENIVKISNVDQYSDINGELLINDSTHLYKTGNPVGIPWNLSEGYILTMKDVNLETNEVWFELSKNDVVVKDDILDVYALNTSIYTSGNGNISYVLDYVFGGTNESVVKISNVNQYSDINGEFLINNSTHLYKTGNPVVIPWILPDGYLLSMKDIDKEGEKVWFELSKDGNSLKEDIVRSNALFTYVNGLESFNFLVSGVMHGTLTDATKIIGVNLYSDAGVKLINNGSRMYATSNPSGEIWQLFEGYSLDPKDVSVDGSKVWLSLSKNGIVVKDEIIDVWDYTTYNWFNYSNSNDELVFSTYVQETFSGTVADIIVLSDSEQYSEINGTLLLYIPDKTLETAITLNNDTTAPTLTITYPADGDAFTSYDNIVTVTGTASDDTAVDSVTVNGILATGTSNWSSNVTLSEGENNITVVAIDYAGNQNVETIIVILNPPSTESISIGFATAALNSTVTIPVSLAYTENISGFSFDLIYNSSIAIVSSVGASANFTGASITPNIDNINDSTRVLLTFSDFITFSSETPVLNITFDVIGDFGSSTSLVLQNVTFSDSDFNPYTPDAIVNGSITVGIKGDLNNNGYVDIGDVAKVAFMVAGKVPENLSADFNDNGYVDIGDAAKIAFYLAGKVSEL